MRYGLLAAAWSGGLALGFRYDAAPWLLALAALVGALLAALAWGRKWPWLPPLLLTAALLAALRVELAPAPPPPLALLPSQPVTVTGTVASDPEAAATRIRFALEVGTLDRGQGPQPARGKLLVYAHPPAELVAARPPPYFRPGDLLALAGDLRQPQPIESFDYPAYLAHQGISGIIWARQMTYQGEGGPVWRGAIHDARRALARSLDAALPAPHAALAQALLIGQRAQLSDDTLDAFRRTGTAHLLAVSGMHVGMLLWAVLGVAGMVWPIGRRWRIYLLAGLAAAAGYAFLSGLSPSVVRAAIMGGVALGAQLAGRPGGALPALGLAGVAMTLADPAIVNQVSFQLSFGAVAGILLAAPWAEGLAAGVCQTLRRAPRWLANLAGWATAALAVSLAATLATWPLVAYHFGQLPLAGPLATLAALPALPLILISAFATAGAGLVSPELAFFPAIFASASLACLLALVSSIPGPLIPLSAPGTLLAGWLTLLAGLLLGQTALRRWRRGVDWRGWLARRLSPTRSRAPGAAPVYLTLAAALAGGLTLLAAQAWASPAGRLHVYFLDVSQGDSALLVTPGGRQILVDGGPEIGGAALALAGVMPPLDKSLDLIVLTHLDADHSRGLAAILDAYRVSGALAGHEDTASWLYPEWRAALRRAGLSPASVTAGQRVDLGDGVALEVLHPPPQPFLGTAREQNNNGVVLRVVYGSASFLLAADLESPAETYLARQPDQQLRSAVLKVAHHGSRTSTTSEFLRRVAPTWAVISAGADNSYGHPHAEVMERLEEMVGPRNIYRTDRQGTIHFSTDGSQMWIATER